jgi:Protein of unknown function (DUF2877)
VSSEKPNLPNGLRIKTPARFAFPDFVRTGEPAACRGGTVRFTRSPLSIDLRTAACWHIDLSGLRIDLHRQDQAAAWIVAWQTLRQYQRGDTIPAIIAAMARAEGAFGTVPALIEAAGALRAEEACAAIKPLVGLGSGLTPAGDDFLVGFLAGLRSTASFDTARLRFLASVGVWLSEAASQTNVISQASIQSVIRGNASEPIARLAEQLDRADSIDNVRAETQAALQVGHSSGTDGVAGFLFGCAAWTKPSLPASHCLEVLGA